MLQTFTLLVVAAATSFLDPALAGASGGAVRSIQEPLAAPPLAAPPQERAAAAAQESQAIPRSLSREEAIVSANRAIGYLVTEQNPDGSWGDNAPQLFEEGYALNSFKAWRMASQALACMALRTAEETPERRRALDVAVDWLVTTPFPARDSDWDIDYVWTALYGTVATIELLEDPRFAEDSRVLERARFFVGVLLSHQATSGGWAYYDDPPFTRQPTWATSFCTALVLPTLARAGAVGVEVPADVIRRARRYLDMCVIPGGAYSYDLDPVTRMGGVEHINRIEGSLGRTQVGNWCRRLMGDKRVTDEVLREGLAAFFREHRYLDHARLRPIPHEGFHANAGYFYFFAHYYAAKVIALLPEPEQEPLHALLRPQLTKTQRENGSTSDFLDTQYLINASTAFMALSLLEGVPKPVAPRPSTSDD